MVNKRCKRDHGRVHTVLDHAETERGRKRQNTHENRSFPASRFCFRTLLLVNVNIIIEYNRITVQQKYF
jgi:hypothetical protein